MSILLSALLLAGSSEALQSLNLPPQTQQAVLVQAPSWSAQRGTLQRFSRSEGKWVAVGREVEVNLGSAGLGWGKGLHEERTDGPQKMEGDGKAPAGIFAFGSAFGYGRTPPGRWKWPYRQVTQRDYWVSDPDSAQYNQLVTLKSSDDPRQLWSSYEEMKRSDGLYEIGLIVDHNAAPVEKEKGSAIFLHVWRGPGSPTAGCTAMSKKNLVALLQWLDPKKEPLLIQVPTPELSMVSLTRTLESK
jgi:L,D-peptidoglycan transpeptidase YkuD (ErfK/YbiS/YcfS/YnhG family)